jgi:hypothetical protein
LDIGKTVDTSDTISNRDDGSGFGVLHSSVLSSGNGTNLGLKETGQLKSLAGHAAGGNPASSLLLESKANIGEYSIFERMKVV